MGGGEEKTAKEWRRGTVVDRALLYGITKGTAPSNGYADETDNPVSTADRVPARVSFPRNSIIRQIFTDADVASEPPSRSTEPEKAALKSFTRDSIQVDGSKLKEISFCRKYDHSEELKDQFLIDYGLTEG